MSDKYYNGTNHVFYSDNENTTNILAGSGQTLKISADLTTKFKNRDLKTDNEGNLIASGLSSKGIFVPPSWGRYWQDALKNSSNSLANIAVVGDSIVQGHRSSDFLSKSFVSLTKARLQENYGDGGTGFVGSKNGFYQAGLSGVQTHVYTTGEWWQTNVVGGPANFGMISSVLDSTMTFELIKGMNIMVYYGISAVGGILEVSVDGAATQSIDCLGDTSIGTYTFTNLSNTTHTVLFTCKSNVSKVVVFGVRGFNDSGITIDNYGNAGQTSGQFVNTTPTAPNIYHGNATDWSGGINTPCNLFVYSIIVNDTRTNYNGRTTNSEDYIRNVMTVLNKIKNGPNFEHDGKTDILFFIPHIGKWQESTNDYFVMCQRLEGICRTYNCAYINMSTMFDCSWKNALDEELWGSTAIEGAPGPPGTDTVHPGDIGHEIYADALLTVLNTIENY